MLESYERTTSYDPEHPEEGCPSHKGATISRPRSTLRSSVRRRSLGMGRAHGIMLGFLVVASAICAARHYFLSYLDGMDVEAFKISQTWVRDIGNALAKVVQLALRFSIGVVLTQSIWLFVRGNHVTLNELDTLFSLPSLESLVPSTLLRGSVLPALVLSAAMEILSLISIFAPNALSVVPAGSPVNSTVAVLWPELDRINVTDSSEFEMINSSGLVRYKGPSSAIQGLTHAVLNGSAILPTAPPSECGRGCSYLLRYRAPALKCTEIPQSLIDVYNTNTSTFTAVVDPSIHVSDPIYFMDGSCVYNATTSFGYAVNPTAASTPLLHSSPFENPFSLDVVFAMNNFTLPFSPSIPVRYNLTGYSCAFHDASYTASFNYSAEGQTTIAHVMDYEMQLGPISEPEGLNLSAIYSLPDVYSLTEGVPSEYDWNPVTRGELQSNYSALALADAFSRYFYGTLAFSNDSASGPAPLYPSSVLNSIFAIRSEAGSGNATLGSLNTLSLSLISTSYNNAAELLQDAFANLTASLASDPALFSGLYRDPSMQPWRPTPAIIIPDTTVYKYQASRLWAVYGIALATTLLVNFYGLFCMVKNAGARQRQFSSIAAAVRAPELDILLGEPGEPLPARAERVRLRYAEEGGPLGERAGFRIAEEDEDRDGE